MLKCKFENSENKFFGSKITIFRKCGLKTSYEYLFNYSHYVLSVSFVGAHSNWIFQNYKFSQILICDSREAFFQFLIIYSQIPEFFWMKNSLKNDVRSKNHKINKRNRVKSWWWGGGNFTSKQTPKNLTQIMVK